MFRLVAILTSAIILAVTNGASALDYPQRPIKWIVPYAAGGGADTLARLIEPEMTKRLGQPIFIENKPGAASSIAAVEVARSSPDGYTIFSADNGTLIYNPALYKKLPYTLAQFLPVAMLARSPSILVVSPSSGLHTLQELVDRVKREPGKISYASSGPGSPHAMAMELLKAKVGLDMIHVPYRGGALSIQDVAAGQVPIAMTDFSSGSGLISAGKLRALAVANPKRMPQLAEVPTFDELGFPGIYAEAFGGIVVPAGTPAEIVTTLQRAIAGALNETRVKARLFDLGQEPVGGDSQQFSAVLNEETARWHKLIKELNISLD
jgi:tripartite-type tricarboxylate transporter receptor subunit TctC